MERRQLESFVTVVEAGSFHGAAARLYVTQSAVSQSVKALEQELGEPLLLRPAGGRSGSLRLSAAGQLFLPIARDILRRFAEGRQAVVELRGLLSGRLALGAVDVAAVYHLPDPLRAFNRAHPGLAISVRVDGSRALAAALREGALDLAFVLAASTPPGLAGRHFRDDPLAVVAPPDLLAGLGPDPPAADVAALGWITYPRRSVSRGLIEAAFEAAGLPFPVLMEIDRPEAILQLVRAGLGLAVLPERLLADAPGAGELARPRLAGLEASRPIRILHRPEEELAPAARAFLTTLD
ncbi:MAG: LysR family transcriptional regulator [Candidatus Latescibacteria bacterium]|nr:LysR family transcriptional regulator [Candidatus Latescibacterota bacterium]MCB9515922.1 LysR family transcriptional regulator [Candidatus Latescibacterota bacterium]